jgi:hypothetical protein
MDLPAGKARDRFVVLRFLRSVRRSEALDAIAGVRAAVQEGCHSVRFSLRPIVIDLARLLLISIKMDTTLTSGESAKVLVNGDVELEQLLRL